MKPDVQVSIQMRHATPEDCCAVCGRPMAIASCYGPVLTVLQTNGMLCIGCGEDLSPVLAAMSLQFALALKMTDAAFTQHRHAMAPAPPENIL